MNTLTNTRQTKMNLDALNKIDEINKLDILIDIELNCVMDFISNTQLSNSIKFLQIVKKRITENIKEQRVLIKNEKMELKQMKLEDKKNKVVKEKVVKEKKEKVVKEKKEKVVKEKKEKVVKQKKEKIVKEEVVNDTQNITLEIRELDEDEQAEDELLTQLHYSNQDMENEQPSNEYEIEEDEEAEETEENENEELIDDIFGDDNEDNKFYCYDCKIEYFEYEKLECAEGNCCIDCGIKNKCVCYICDYKELQKASLVQEQITYTVLNPPISDIIINVEPFIYGSLNDSSIDIIEEINPEEDIHITDEDKVESYFKSIQRDETIDILFHLDIVKCKFIQLRKFRVELFILEWTAPDGNVKQQNINKKLIVGLKPITIVIKHKPVEIIPEIIHIKEQNPRNIFVKTDKDGIYIVNTDGIKVVFNPREYNIYKKGDRQYMNFAELEKYNTDSTYYTTDKFMFYHTSKGWTVTAQYIQTPPKSSVKFSCKIILIIDKNGIELPDEVDKIYDIKYEDISDVRDI